MKINKKQVTQLMTLLAAEFQNMKVTELRVATWSDILQDCTFEQVTNAVREFLTVAGTDFSRSPSIGDIASIVARNVKDEKRRAFMNKINKTDRRLLQ